MSSKTGAERSGGENVNVCGERVVCNKERTALNPALLYNASFPVGFPYCCLLEI